MTPDEISKALEGFEAAEPPVTLYRFYSRSALNALIEGTLKITPPEKLNDPFEMAPGIDADSLTEDSVRRALLSETSLSRFAVLWARDAPLSQIENPEPVYRCWVEREIAMGPDRWLVHLLEMRKGLTHAISQNFGVACFSAFSEEVLNGPTGIKHWAMYAEDHKGFCIEYDGGHRFFRDLAASKWLFPVRYYGKRPAIGIAEFEDWPQRKYLQVLRQWSEMKCRKAWEDEAEWRLICTLTPDDRAPFEISVSGEHHLIHLWRTSEAPEERANSAAIRRVILGVRSEELKDTMTNVLKAPHLKHVGLYQARICDRHFALRLERVQVDR